MAPQPNSNTLCTCMDLQNQLTNHKLKTMETNSKLLFPALFVSFISLHIYAQNLDTYIVQLHPNRIPNASKPAWHRSIIKSSISSQEFPSSRLLYSYHSTMEGFSARLTPDEVQFLRNSHDVLSIRPDRKLHLHTTYSYKFLGLSPIENGAWSKSNFGKGTIIGVLDTGVWPESSSFSDLGMPPVPKKWKGICQQGQFFNSSSCNRKIIGARFFQKGHNLGSRTQLLPRGVVEYESPRDSQGHGTHTSSTATGSPVSAASVFGNGFGVARGMAPMAHIAVYKVCWYTGCYSSDILAAMDAAILDGVDVLSLSLGGFPLPLYEDSIAIGSFRAVERGISVICSAGNNGPIQYSVANDAPWIATIGASTLDRRFPGIVRLANGKMLYGESIFPGNKSSERELELVYLTGGGNGREFCLKGSLKKSEVKGRMVICDRGVNGRAEKGQVVKKAGGSAMILANTAINLEEDSVDAHVITSTLIGFDESTTLKSFINSTKNPRARIIFGGTTIGHSRAPAVAQFSSRGPSFINPSILKPDLIAPGVNIIAAWPQNLGPTGLREDSRRVNFSIMSGTSMSCPHVSGIAALLRSAHPKWTPSAIKSAMMTSADIEDHFGKPIMDGDKYANFFAVGAGHINPERAISPGLVYDIKPYDYTTYLCRLRYTDKQIFIITHKNVACSDILNKSKRFYLNYPSISVHFRNGVTRRIVERQLTNVGTPNSVYSVRVKAPEGTEVKVKPQKLVFEKVKQTLSYKMWVVSRKKIEVDYAQGYLTWVHSHNEVYKVRSPISVTWQVSKRKEHDDGKRM